MKTDKLGGVNSEELSHAGARSRVRSRHHSNCVGIHSLT